MSEFSQIYRSIALKIASNDAVEKIITKQGQVLARRFIAGEDSEQAVDAIRQLDKRGIKQNLDLLGEFVSDVDAANTNTELIIENIEKVASAGFAPYNSIKLSAIGQGIEVNNSDLGDINIEKIVSTVKKYGGFVNLDMEDHTRVDITLNTFRNLVNKFGNEYVGTVLQAYLHRTLQDISNLSDLNPNLRIVKGAYLEPAEVALQDKKAIDRTYRDLVYIHLQNGNYCNIATHDQEIIYDLINYAIAYGISKDQFEFQLLYGVREDLQDELVKAGYTVRSYVPYGKDWYGYYSRRIAERPQNAMFVLRGMLGK